MFSPHHIFFSRTWYCRSLLPSCHPLFLDLPESTISLFFFFLIGCSILVFSAVMSQNWDLRPQTSPLAFWHCRNVKFSHGENTCHISSNLRHKLFHLLYFLTLKKFSPEDNFINFRERGKERETLIWERNINWLLWARAPPGDQMSTPACALTRNWTCNPFGSLDNAPTHWVPGQGFSPFPWF